MQVIRIAVVIKGNITNAIAFGHNPSMTVVAPYPDIFVLCASTFVDLTAHGTRVFPAVESKISEQ